MVKNTIIVPIYNSIIEVITVKCITDVNELYSINAESNYDSFVFIHLDKIIMVLPTTYNLAVIVHEVVHIVNFIFKSCGVKLDIDNDEPQAYLTSWLFNEISELLILQSKKQLVI